MSGTNKIFPPLSAVVMGIAWAVASWAPQESTPSATIPVTIVVSVEAKHGKDVPTIHREDVRVFEAGERRQVTNWVALQGNEAELELFILLDDALESAVSLQFDDLRQFINAQPATTAIAVGYMHHGTVEVAQDLTKDRAQLGKALRLPLGSPGISASPYLSISDLVRRWPESSARREILLISDGVDPLYGGPSNPYLSTAIDDAHRAGIQVYALYASAVGHRRHSFWRLNWGQNNLSQLTEETGGEAYFLGFQTPVSFAPFLEQFADRLKHQYRLTFLAKAQKKAHHQSVRLETEVPNAELVAADRVYVPAME